MKKFYKIVTCKDKRSIFVSKFNYRDYIASGNWMPKINNTTFCKRGYHFTDKSGIIDWSVRESVDIYEIEPEKYRYDSYDNKYVSSSIRFIKKVGRININDISYLSFLLINKVYNNFTHVFSRTEKSKIKKLLNLVLEYRTLTRDQKKIYNYRTIKNITNYLQKLIDNRVHDCRNYILHELIEISDFDNFRHSNIYGFSINKSHIRYCFNVAYHETLNDIFSDLLISYLENKKKKEESLYAPIIDKLNDEINFIKR